MLNENKIELDVENAIIIGDSDLLEVVIRNLIENSNKSEPKDNIILIKGENFNRKI